MDSYAPGDSVGSFRTSTQKSQAGSAKSISSPQPESANIGHARTELPKEPESIYHAFERAVPDPIAIGNHQLELGLRLQAQLGNFLQRNKSAQAITPVELKHGPYRNAVIQTLGSVLTRLLRNKGFIEDEDIKTRAYDTATTLADGVCIMTYLKVRAVNSLEYDQASKFLRRPKVPSPFEVPSPYALAISQLGIVHVSSLVDEIILSPTLSTDGGKFFCLPDGVNWIATQYAQAVEYAKSLGMQFSTVDQQVKIGSSWWLFAQDFVDNIFSLRCPLPEINFTEATAAIHTLFCVNEAGGAYNPFVELGNIANKDFGTMLRNPPGDINVTSYFAVEAVPEVLWNEI